MIWVDKNVFSICLRPHIIPFNLLLHSCAIMLLYCLPCGYAKMGLYLSIKSRTIEFPSLTFPLQKQFPPVILATCDRILEA